MEKYSRLAEIIFMLTYFKCLISCISFKKINLKWLKIFSEYLTEQGCKVPLC